jgi:4-hydroxymandelate oxidase
LHRIHPRWWSRRLFVNHLLASPFYGMLGSGALTAQNDDSGLITSPEDAINLFDLELVAKKKIAPHHWEYLLTGSDDEKTVQANRDGFDLFQIRPRRFVDASTPDTSCKLFGETYSAPVLLAPAGSQEAFHPEAEIATAKAAGVMGTQCVLSTVSSRSVSDVARAYDRKLWFQLYATTEWSAAEALIRKADEAGCTALALTLDSPVLSNRERVKRARRSSKVDCSVCHDPSLQGYFRAHPNFDGINLSQVRDIDVPYTWELIDRIRKTTDMKLLAKGVLRPEDAELCVQRGLDAVWVSNHGGRQLNSLLSPIEALPEIVQAVGGKSPVLVDSGFRRGTDIFKALALGADAVCIGRPYLWGLGAFGEEGVKAAIRLADAELRTTMTLAGTPSISDIDSTFVRRRR